MKNLSINLLLLIFVLILSCTKKVEQPIFVVNDVISLNNYTPTKDDINDKFWTFKSELEMRLQPDYKNGIEPTDRPIDEAVWLIETVTNNEYGFKNDSIGNMTVDSTIFVVNNKSINELGIPIIDGNDILQVYTQIENGITEDANNEKLFWAGHLQITSVNEENSELVVYSAEGEKDWDRYYGVLPPGSPLVPFPSGTTFHAGDLSDLMVEAELEFWKKMRSPIIHYPAPGYAFVFDYTWYVHPNCEYGNPQYEDMYWGMGYNPWGVILNYQQLNDHLYATKNAIDANYPENEGDFIGYYHIYTPCITIHPSRLPDCSMTNLDWHRHKVVLWYYNTVWVGFPDN